MLFADSTNVHSCRGSKMKKGEFKTASGHTAVVIQCRQRNMQFVWGGYIKCPATGAFFMQRWSNDGLNYENPNYNLVL